MNEKKKHTCRDIVRAKNKAQPESRQKNTNGRICRHGHDLPKPILRRMLLAFDPVPVELPAPPPPPLPLLSTAASSPNPDTDRKSVGDGSGPDRFGPSPNSALRGFTAGMDGAGDAIERSSIPATIPGLVGLGPDVGNSRMSIVLLVEISLTGPEMSVRLPERFLGIVDVGD